MLGTAGEGDPLTEPDEPDYRRELLGAHSEVHVPSSPAAGGGFRDHENIDWAHVEALGDELGRGLGGGGECATSP